MQEKQHLQGSVVSGETRANFPVGHDYGLAIEYLSLAHGHVFPRMDVVRFWVPVPLSSDS